MRRLAGHVFERRLHLAQPQGQGSRVPERWHLFAASRHGPPVQWIGPGIFLFSHSPPGNKYNGSVKMNALSPCTVNDAVSYAKNYFILSLLPRTSPLSSGKVTGANKNGYLSCISFPLIYTRLVFFNEQLHDSFVRIFRPPSPLYTARRRGWKQKQYGLLRNCLETYTKPEKFIFKWYRNPYIYILHPKYFPEDGLPDGSPEYLEYNALGRTGSRVVPDVLPGVLVAFVALFTLTGFMPGGGQPRQIFVRFSMPWMSNFLRIYLFALKSPEATVLPYVLSLMH